MNKYLDYLGHTVKDVITGLTGICESVYFGVGGDIDILIRPEDITHE